MCRDEKNEHVWFWFEALSGKKKEWGLFIYLSVFETGLRRLASSHYVVVGDLQFLIVLLPPPRAGIVGRHHCIKGFMHARQPPYQLSFPPGP